MDIKVSVVCTAYNHEHYLEKTLNGFISQKTDFPFEVLVHDDASTDHTADIIRKYAKQYPDIIKPIYQTENQYSKRVAITAKLLIPQARGEYFAFCEGDDYWTDPNKLQKQADYMDQHPECTLCIHNAICVADDGHKIKDYIVTDTERDIPTEEVIMGGGPFCATASIFTRTELVRNYPAYYFFKPCDFAIQIYLASCGVTHCFTDSMSAYRVQAKGSWTERFLNAGTEVRTNIAMKNVKMLEDFDHETKEKYHQTVLTKQGLYILENMLDSGTKVGYDRTRCRLAMKKLPPRSRLAVRVLRFSPKLFRKIVNHRRH